jgi:hypothetical protein
MPRVKEHPADKPGSVTARQRRRLFALCKRRGLDADGLRALTPRGSISQLTFREANMLADNLQAGLDWPPDRRKNQSKPRPEPAAEGVVRLRTDFQLELIENMRIQCGFTPAELDTIVRRSTGIDGGMAKLASRQDASKVISTLYAIGAKAERKRPQW